MDGKLFKSSSALLVSKVNMMDSEQMAWAWAYYFLSLSMFRVDAPMTDFPLSQDLSKA